MQAEWRLFLLGLTNYLLLTLWRFNKNSSFAVLASSKESRGEMALIVS